MAYLKCHAWSFTYFRLPIVVCICQCFAKFVCASGAAIIFNLGCYIASPNAPPGRSLADSMIGMSLKNLWAFIISLNMMLWVTMVWCVAAVIHAKHSCPERSAMLWSCLSRLCSCLPISVWRLLTLVDAAVEWFNKLRLQINPTKCETMRLPSNVSSYHGAVKYGILAKFLTPSWYFVSTPQI